MIFDRIVGNIETETGAQTSSTDDWLDLNWQDCLMRAHRRKTRSGAEIRILLPLGVQIHHGDLIANGVRTVAIAVRPCDVLLLHPPDAETAILLALGLGNLHAPVQLDGKQMMVIPDGPVEELLAELKVPSTPAVRRFQPASIAAPLRAQLAANFQVIRL